MGTLTYDGIAVDFDDRLLSHLQIVIINKLRRREGFAMSWRDDPQVGDGRSTIWLDPAIPLYFRFADSSHPTINKEWLTRLADTSNSSTGLVVIDEQD
jgi:hypothetical protein